MSLFKTYNDKASVYENNINKFVVNLVGINERILDVGCSDGALGEFLQKYKNAEVTGIDISSIAVKKAKRVLHKALVANIEENEELDLPLAYFDVITYADIIEHLFDPESVLRRFNRYLKKGGYVIISTPNIVNINIRFGVLKGNFDYTEHGILDNSHIRFFTKKNLKNMVEKTGLQIEKWDYSPGFGFLFLKEKNIKNMKLLVNLKRILTRTNPKLFSAQFIIKAKKI